MLRAQNIGHTKALTLRIFPVATWLRAHSIGKQHRLSLVTGLRCTHTCTQIMTKDTSDENKMGLGWSLVFAYR